MGAITRNGGTLNREGPKKHERLVGKGSRDKSKGKPKEREKEGKLREEKRTHIITSTHKRADAQEKAKKNTNLAVKVWKIKKSGPG